MLEIIHGDITKLNVDAIVNAANTSLLGGGGVDGAIHRAGGKAILEACIKIRDKQGGCPTGEAVITTGGKLPAKFVIHTVGPVWNGGAKNEAGLLEACYSNTLILCLEHDIKTIAFPNMSTGIYGYPKQYAAQVAIHAVNRFIHEHPNAIEKIIFVCFDEENYLIYKKLLTK